jgi:hypothetical protein
VLNLRAGFVGFVVDTVALGEDFLWLLFFPVSYSSIAPCSYTVEPRLSELRLTETRVNRNACQLLRFPELSAATHLWGPPSQFVVKSWRVQMSGKLTCVCFLQCSFNIPFNSDSKECQLDETCCNDNWTEIGGCETN